MRCLFINFKF